jgi:hypothetical protein
MFSVDTSAFLDAWARHYPLNIFPTLWAYMEKAAKDGVIKVSEEVVEELSRKDDGACDWIKAQPEMIIPTDEDVQKEITSILKIHPRLVNVSKNRSGGDPFVIAVARLRGYSVITGEVLTGNATKPRIPDVCVALNVPYLDILEFIRRQSWKI